METPTLGVVVEDASPTVKIFMDSRNSDKIAAGQALLAPIHINILALGHPVLVIVRPLLQTFLVVPIVAATTMTDVIVPHLAP